MQAWPNNGRDISVLRGYFARAVKDFGGLSCADFKTLAGCSSDG